MAHMREAEMRMRMEGDEGAEGEVEAGAVPDAFEGW